MSELPPGWVTVQLGSVIDGIEAGKNIRCIERPPVRNESGIVKISAVTWGEFRENESKTVPLGVALDERARINPGDLLISRANTVELVGAAVRVEQISKRLYLSDKVLRIRAASELLPWIHRALTTPEVRKELAARSSGNQLSMRNISQESLRTLDIPVAPAAEQRRILKKVEALLASASRCRRRLERVSEMLDRFRRAVLEAAVSGRLTEEWRSLNPALVDATEDAGKVRKCHDDAGGHVKGNAAPPSNNVHDLEQSMFPDGWALVELRELVEPDRPITYGILKPGDDLSGGIPYVRVADYPGNVLNLPTVRRTSPVIDRQFARSRLREGDLLLSIRGTVGRVIQIPKELETANITQDSARLSIQRSVDRLYVLWFLRSRLAQSRMQRALKGVAVRGINIGDVRALQVPLPSRAEQREIVRRTEELMAMAGAMEHQALAAMSRVSRLTPGFLSKAFQGRLVSQNRMDEPASEMLKRIQAGHKTSGDTSLREATLIVRSRGRVKKGVREAKRRELRGRKRA